MWTAARGHRGGSLVVPSLMKHGTAVENLQVGSDRLGPQSLSRGDCQGSCQASHRPVETEGHQGSALERSWNSDAASQGRKGPTYMQGYIKRSHRALSGRGTLGLVMVSHILSLCRVWLTRAEEKRIRTLPIILSFVIPSGIASVTPSLL